MSNFYIDKILEETKITDFLYERGINPVKKSGDKWLYRCPVHSGDNDPSFIVYPVGTKGRNYQTYHCFGCHSGINIINLKRDMDNITSREAIAFFLKDIDIDPVDSMDSIIEAGKRENFDKVSEDDGDKTIELLMLSLNTICRNYLEEYGDEEEYKFFDEKFYKKVDEIAISRDIDTLDAYRQKLIDNEVLENRAESSRKRQFEEETSASKWII